MELDDDLQGFRYQDGERESWDFGTSFLYSLSLITTVGKQ